MAIGDGFDDRFVRKPGSIECVSAIVIAPDSRSIAHNLFNAFNGAATNDKDVVVQGVTCPSLCHLDMVLTGQGR